MKLTVKEMAVFSMLGTLMYCTKFVTEMLPNIHLMGTFIVAFTVVYRKKALYPIYIFVLLNGLMSGFATWWIPYLYMWTILWAAVMVLPKNMPRRIRAPVYVVVSALHGFLFGIMYAPAQALLFGLNYEQMIAWIMAGIPFDIIHGVSNIFCGLLIMPIIKVLRTAEKYSSH